MINSKYPKVMDNDKLGDKGVSVVQDKVENGSCPAIELREAVPDDSTFVYDVRRQAFRQYVDRVEGWNESTEQERHNDRFERQHFRIIWADGVPVGYMATAEYDKATPDHPAALYLHQLMLLPSAQSKGIGSACLGVLASEAHLLGLPVRLRVLRANPRALAFYVANGYKVVGQSSWHVTLQMVTQR